MKHTPCQPLGFKIQNIFFKARQVSTSRAFLLNPFYLMMKTNIVHP